MSQIAPSTGKYVRSMGTFGVLLLVVNGLIGAGIFGLPEVLHEAVGSFAPWLLLLGGILVGCIAICFAQLTGLTDRSGGPQRFTTDAYGRFPGFQVGWLFYSARVVSDGANVLVLLAYAAAIWPAVEGGLAQDAAIVAILGFITIVNIVGLRNVVAVLGAMTVFKLVPLFVLIVAGLGAAAAPGPVVLPQISNIEGIALAALYAFVGFENATIPAGETRNPQRSMPRALLIGLAFVTLVYFSLQWAYSLSPLAGSGSEAPLAALAGQLGGELGTILLSATVVVSVLANLTAGQTSASRMTPALADDGLLPAWFGKVGRFGTPSNAIVFHGLLGMAFALTGTFLELAIVSTLARLLAYVASIASLPLLRRAAGRRAVTAPLAVVMAIALALSLWLAAQADQDRWVMLGMFALVGTALYFIARRRPENG